MIREAMEKVLRLLMWGERARMGHVVQTGGEEGAAEWGKRESGMVTEEELAGGRVIWTVCQVKLLWSCGAAGMHISLSL